MYNNKTEQFFTHNHPLPNLPPRGKEILSPLGEIRKGVRSD